MSKHTKRQKKRLRITQAWEGSGLVFEFLKLCAWWGLPRVKLTRRPGRARKTGQLLTWAPSFTFHLPVPNSRQHGLP